MGKYNVWITLVKEYEAEDSDEAFELAMNDIEHRDGMEISSHEVIEEETPGECGDCKEIYHHSQKGQTCRGCGRGVIK